MSDFLLELRCEEIPARMQAGARADLEKLFRAQMGAAGVSLGALTVWSTPRRLALIAADLPLATAAVSEELKGPKTSAPPQALEGFLRKTGLTQDQLTERDGVYFAVSNKPGRATVDVLAEAIPAIIRAFPWPKSQRWGAASISTESLRWVRPLSGIVAILGEDLVACEMGNIRSGYATLGHRFHHLGEITIGGASDYQEKLRACHVIVSHVERQDLIRAKAAEVATAAGLVLVTDEGLVIENAGLTEWPVPLLGRFDEAFLEVPPEVIQLTARTNQKYFVCQRPAPLQGRGRSGEAAEGVGASVQAQPQVDSPHPPAPGPEGEWELANAFVCTANIEATDGGVGIVAGNRKVLAARLSDARFFWQQDRKTALAEQAQKLERITFHEKLGSVADKTERVAKLARWLVEEGVVRSAGADPSQLADQAEQAARLCKADLVTEMVGEFPELQGLMGGYYARAEGLPDAVADAIRDHYKPVGQADAVPTAPVTIAVALADKLDSIAGFFAIAEAPTGSKDPFALRRAALGALQIISTNGLRFPLQLAMAPTVAFTIADQEVSGPEKSADTVAALIDTIAAELNSDDHRARLAMLEVKLNTYKTALATVDKERILARADRVLQDIVTFFADRLKVQQKEAGVRHDLIDAVFKLGGEDDLVRLLARVHALQAFVGTEDGANLLAGYKRAANILKKEDWRGIEGEIAQTGEEDPLALVDDPDLAPVIAAKMAERHERVLSYAPEPAEEVLMDALDSAGSEVADAIAGENFGRAMAALASLRAPIDAFFDTVTVNDTDQTKRAGRLDLLSRFRKSVHQVADFSKIEG